MKAKSTDGDVPAIERFRVRDVQLAPNLEYSSSRFLLMGHQGSSRRNLAISTNSSQIELMRSALALCGGCVAPAWTGIFSSSSAGIASPSTCRGHSALAEALGTEGRIFKGSTTHQILKQLHSMGYTVLLVCKVASVPGARSRMVGRLRDILHSSSRYGRKDSVNRSSGFIHHQKFTSIFIAYLREREEQSGFLEGARWRRSRGGDYGVRLLLQDIQSELSEEFSLKDLVKTPSGFIGPPLRADPLIIKQLD